MTIQSIQLGSTGLAGVAPSFVYIDTDNTIAEVSTAGFLNGASAEGFAFNNKQIAMVSTIDAGTTIALLYHVDVAANGNITLVAY